MNLDLTFTALSLWFKSGVLSTEEFNEIMKSGNEIHLLLLLNSKLDKLDFEKLQSKIKECMIDDSNN